jgi:15-cis-phytoene synthase/lycopene beta-cyclase
LIDAGLLYGLQLAEDTLKKGSKSFEVAKLAFGREMRIGLVAVYAWCRVTVSRLSEAGASG